MDTKREKQNATDSSQSGIFVRGCVIHNEPRKIRKKDGSSLVIVTHELSVRPGVIHLQRYIDPSKSQEVEIQGDEVTKYPAFKINEPIMAKIQGIEDFKGDKIAKNWELIDSI